MSVLNCATGLLSIRQYRPSLDLAWAGIDQNLLNFEEEALNRPYFIEPTHILGDSDAIRGARTAVTLGWLAAIALIKFSRNEQLKDAKKLSQVIRREMPNLRITGEVDWPIFVCLSLYFEKLYGARAGEALLDNWVKVVISANMQSNTVGLASPYWLHDKVLKLYSGLLPPYQTEIFSQHSYTIQPAMDMLVRRLCRRHVSIHWPKASRLTFNNYVPDEPAEWFVWQSFKGDLHSVVPKQPVSWTEWRKSVSVVKHDSVPNILLKHPEWVLPFALTYPHRMNQELSGLIDCLISGKADLI